MRRGDVYYADLRPVIGSEQGGIRPVLIVQNDVGNKHSPTIICAAITSKMNKAKLPTHIELNAKRYDMDKDSVVLRRPAMVDYGVEGFHLTGSIIPFESVQLDHEDVLVTLPMYTVVYVVTFDEDEQHPVVKKYHEYLAGVTDE